MMEDMNSSLVDTHAAIDLVCEHWQKLHISALSDWDWRLGCLYPKPTKDMSAEELSDFQADFAKYEQSQQEFRNRFGVRNRPSLEFEAAQFLQINLAAGPAVSLLKERKGYTRLDRGFWSRPDALSLILSGSISPPVDTNKTGQLFIERRGLEEALSGGHMNRNVAPSSSNSATPARTAGAPTTKDDFLIEAFMILHKDPNPPIDALELRKRTMNRWDKSGQKQISEKWAKAKIDALWARLQED